MAHRILVAVDGSEPSEQALPWADELASALAAQIELLEVLPSDGEPGEDRVPQPVQTETLARARTLIQRAPEVQATALRGSPAEVIVARAEATTATLIAMGSHGRSGLARAALGSVAGDVVRHSTVPVLVVSSQVTLESAIPGRVLVPLDETEHARTVFAWLSPLARELGWTLILCAVADLPPQPIPVQGAAITLPTGPIHTPVEMSTYLEELSAGLQADGFAVEIQVALGDPAPAIGSIAAETRAGLIAMSTHGRHGLARWALGSITEAVIQQATVPVLAMHPREP